MLLASDPFTFPRTSPKTEGSFQEAEGLLRPHRDGWHRDQVFAGPGPRAGRAGARGGSRMTVVKLPGRSLTRTHRGVRESKPGRCQEGVSPAGSFAQQQMNKAVERQSPPREGPGTSVPTAASEEEGALWHMGPRRGVGEAAAPALWPQFPRSGAKRDEFIGKVPLRST